MLPENFEKCKAIALAVCLTLCVVAPATAATLNVPSQYATIQAAINAAADGDEIVVADGTYSGTGNVDLNMSKAVTLRSASNDPTACIVDGENTSKCISQWQTSSTVPTTVRGITFYRGQLSSLNGGGLTIQPPSSVVLTIKVENCIIDSCVGGQGGGVYVNGSAGFLNVTLDECTFLYNSSNSSTSYGGALYAGNGKVIVKGCRFEGNSTNSGATFGRGGAIYQPGAPTAPDLLYIVNSTFVDNAVPTTGSFARGGALHLYHGPQTQVVNCLFYENSVGSSGRGSVAYFESGATSAVFCNNTLTDNVATGASGLIYSNTTSLNLDNGIVYNNDPSGYGGSVSSRNTVTSDPHFVSPGSPDYNYRLLSTSNARANGSETYLPADLADLDGDLNTSEAVPLDMDLLSRVYGGMFNPEWCNVGSNCVGKGCYEYQGTDVGACCAVDGTCSVTEEADCVGTWQGAFTDCDPSPCGGEPTGACCAADGTCTVETEADCLAASGTYQGDGTDCDPNPCPQPTGACCAADGTCTVETEADCLAASGTYQGDDTDCDPNPCPQPTGACCAADGTCTVETEADCLAASGTYQGDGTDCDPNPCPQPTTHALTLTPDATCYTTSGGTVTVDIVFTQTGTNEILGGQFFLDYDETKLDFVSADTGDVPFTNEVYEDVNETGGTIDYAVGLPLAGDPGYSGAGPLTMATITFQAIGEACDVADLVTFRDTGQPYETRLTKRVGVDGSEPFVPEGLNDLEAITLDWTIPTITCPTDINQTADAGVCYATIADLGTPTTGDNCGVASVTNDKPANDQYAVGVTTVTWTVTDTCGNTATCEQTVTVTDDEDPTITCPADINQTADAGVCYATITDLGTPTTGDNCGVDTVTNDKPVDDQYPVGTTIVTWTVTDIHGNTATCEQTVIVTDDEDPTIACPADVQVTADAGVCYATGVALGTPTTDDNCAVDTVTNDAPAQFPVGDTTVTWTVTDIHGNSATCEQTVTVTDDEDPTITCPTDVQVTADAGVCYATGVALGTPTTDDNCAVDTVTNDAPSQFPVGDTTVTWTVTDIHGNSATCEQTVTVTDDEDPVITGCPDDITVNADAGTCDAVVTWTPPTVDDNCGIQSFTSSHNPGDTFGPGTTTVTYTATDIHGNTSTCTFDVTVLGFSDFVVDVQLQGIDTAVTRCITFTFVNCTTMDTATLEKDMAFDATGIGSATFTDLPCGVYDCVTAEDELHTLLVRLDSAPDFEIVGTAYVADFTGANLLTTADYYNDNLIDIADFGTFIAQWGACYDSDSDSFCDGDTPCGVFAQNSHADANGDGVLDVTDFNPISGNFLSLGDDDCCRSRSRRRRCTSHGSHCSGTPSGRRA